MKQPTKNDMKINRIIKRVREIIPGFTGTISFELEIFSGGITSYSTTVKQTVRDMKKGETE